MRLLASDPFSGPVLRCDGSCSVNRTQERRFGLRSGSTEIDTMDARMSVYVNASWRAVLLVAILSSLVQGQEVQVSWSKEHASKEQQTNRYIDASARSSGGSIIYLGVSEFRKVDVGQEITLAIWACNSNGEVVQKTTILTEATEARHPSPGTITALAALPNNHRVMIAKTDGIHEKIVRID